MEKHLEGLHRQRAGELVVAGGRRQPQPLKSEGEVRGPHPEPLSATFDVAAKAVQIGGSVSGARGLVSKLKLREQPVRPMSALVYLDGHFCSEGAYDAASGYQF